MCKNPGERHYDVGPLSDGEITRYHCEYNFRGPGVEMTVVIAWVRTIQHCEELIFVSDSRLNDWRNFDVCPKIITLPRNDCAIAFAGDTKDATLKGQ